VIRSRAAERADGTGWHYVRGGHPVGYCATHAPHATEDAARACFGQWQRDHIILERDRYRWTNCFVHGCANPAKHGARIEGDGYNTAVLCDDHLTTEDAITAMHLDVPAGDQWES
jgi:hypothetical protein